MSADGPRAERAVRDELRENGYVVYRAAGSHGHADLVALKAHDECPGCGRSSLPPMLVQVKASARGPFDHFPPAERVALLQEAAAAGAHAVLAWRPGDRRGVRWIDAADWPTLRAVA